MSEIVQIRRPAPRLYTRRDLAKLATVGIIGCALEGPASAHSRAMLGVRGAMMAESGGGGWTNPYVTDGLVAMWDGVWADNAGSPHPSAVRTWTDIVGGYSVTCAYDAENDGHSMHTYIDGTNHYGFFMQQDVRESIVGAMTATDSFSVEFVVECPSISATYNNGMSFALSDTCFVQTNTGVSYAGFNLEFCGKNGIILDYTPETSQNVSVVKTGDTANIYVNGSPHSTLTGLSGLTAVCGNWTHQYFGCFTPQYLCCFRCYGRALSAAEVLANYRTDKPRFSLP